MRVGIDIGPATRRRSGVGNYCVELVRALAELTDITLKGLAVTARSLDTSVLPSSFAVRRLPVPTRLMYAAWSSAGMPSVEALIGGVDVYHATNYFLPPVRRAKRVLTVHDLTFRKYPELCSPKVVGPFSSKVGRFAREADAVIADSESTRRDIIELLDVPAERVHAVHLAADPRLKPIPEADARGLVATRFKITPPYLLFVGTLEPRKNIANLLKAFKSLEDEVPHCMVFAGALGWGVEKDIPGRAVSNPSAVAATKAGVHVLGYVPDSDLSALYSAADALVFPSLYEGFGLPVLEAMACGCPVITANNSSLPEVAGDAAEYCDANDVDSIVMAIRRVLSDAAFRRQMTERGFAQAANFSWAKTAAQTAAVYRSVLG